MPIEEIADKAEGDLNEFLYRKVRAAYRQKDVEFPVRVAMQNFMSDKPQAAAGSATTATACTAGPRSASAPSWPRKTAADALADPGGFFAAAFKAIEAEGLTEEYIRTESRSKLREKLMEIAPKAMPKADIDEIDAKVDEVFSGAKCRRGRGREGTGRLGEGGTRADARSREDDRADARRGPAHAAERLRPEVPRRDALGRAEPGAGTTRQCLEVAPAGRWTACERRAACAGTPRKTRRSSTSARA